MLSAVLVTEHLIDFIQEILIAFCFDVGHLMKRDKIECLRVARIVFCWS